MEIASYFFETFVLFHINRFFVARVFVLNVFYQAFFIYACFIFITDLVKVLLFITINNKTIAALFNTANIIAINDLYRLRFWKVHYYSRRQNVMWQDF